MIERKIAENEIRRFGCLGFPPDTDEGLEEIVATLADASRSKEHCQRTVSELIRFGGQRWPTPGAIREVAWSLLSEDEQHAGTGCKRCSGVGWLHVQRGKYSAVQECGCRPKAVTA